MKLIRLYRANKAAQLEWIRNHPFQYIILNGVLFGLWLGYIEYRDHKDKQEIEKQHSAV